MRKKHRTVRTLRPLAAGVISAMLAVQLMACSATELEDRCFPMLAAADYRVGLTEFAYGFPELSQKDNTDVDEAKVAAVMAQGNDFEGAVREYEKQLEKVADCNHLKVLVIGRDLAAEREQCLDMLESLRKSELFPRNIYVCVTDDMGELWESEKSLPSDLGSYLELFLMNHEPEHDRELVTLGTLLDETQNHRKVLYLPYLFVKNGAILWESDWMFDMTAI